MRGATPTGQSRGRPRVQAGAAAEVPPPRQGVPTRLDTWNRFEPAQEPRAMRLIAGIRNILYVSRYVKRTGRRNCSEQFFRPIPVAPGGSGA
jgi:hypothetical protein